MWSCMDAGRGREELRIYRGCNPATQQQASQQQVGYGSTNTGQGTETLSPHRNTLAGPTSPPRLAWRSSLSCWAPWMKQARASAAVAGSLDATCGRQAMGRGQGAWRGVWRIRLAHGRTCPRTIS